MIFDKNSKIPNLLNEMNIKKPKGWMFIYCLQNQNVLSKILTASVKEQFNQLAMVEDGVEWGTQYSIQIMMLLQNNIVTQSLLNKLTNSPSYRILMKKQMLFYCNVYQNSQKYRCKWESKDACVVLGHIPETVH